MFKSSNADTFLAKALLLPKLFGMFPMTRDYRLSIPGVLRAAVCFSVAIFTTFKTVSFLYITIYRWALSKYLDFLELGLLMVSILICFVLSLKMGRHVRSVVYNLDSIDSSLNRMNKKVIYCHFYNTGHNLIRVLTILAMLAEQFILPFHAESWWDNLYYVITLLLGFLILHLFLCPFYAFLNAFYVHFKALKEMIDDLNVDVDREWRRKIERIVHLYIELYHSCCIVDRMFTMIAFVVVSAAFTLIVKNIYFVCYIIIEYGKMRWKKAYHIAVSVTYISMWVIEICTIAFSCARLTSQVYTEPDIIKKSNIIVNCKNSHCLEKGIRKSTLH